MFSHFIPRDATRGNSFFQMSSYARANVRMINDKNKRKIPMRAWSEMGKQNVQAKEVYWVIIRQIFPILSAFRSPAKNSVDCGPPFAKSPKSAILSHLEIML